MKDVLIGHANLLSVLSPVIRGKCTRATHDAVTHQFFLVECYQV